MEQKTLRCLRQFEAKGCFGDVEAHGYIRLGDDEINLFRDEQLMRKKTNKRELVLDEDMGDALLEEREEEEEEEEQKEGLETNAPTNEVNDNAKKDESKRGGIAVGDLCKVTGTMEALQQALTESNCTWDDEMKLMLDNPVAWQCKDVQPEIVTLRSPEDDYLKFPAGFVELVRKGLKQGDTVELQKDEELVRAEFEKARHQWRAEMKELLGKSWQVVDVDDSDPLRVFFGLMSEDGDIVWFPEVLGTKKADAKDLAATTKKVQKALLRPPRTVKGIVAAVLSAFGLALVGAVTAAIILRLADDATEKACTDSKAPSEFGLDALHIVKFLGAVYCKQLHASWPLEVSVVCAVAAAGALLGIRLSYGRAYLSGWDDAEEFAELQRLYCVRTRGSYTVIRTLRYYHIVRFCVTVVVLLWFRYIFDLYLDIQAMVIFWNGTNTTTTTNTANDTSTTNITHTIETGTKDFFWVNLLGIVLGLLWTAYEMVKMVGEDARGIKVSRNQIFFIGLTLPLFGGHVTYLAGLSLWNFTAHPFLFISTLAEAMLESAVSSYVQTYALVFSPLTEKAKQSLYISIFSSFLSIGYAFSMLDQAKGGRTLAQLPGACEGHTLKWFVVFIFRFCETTSRGTSLALFQQATHPYGMFYMMFVDLLAVLGLSAYFQYKISKDATNDDDRWSFVQRNLFYAVPSWLCCLMAPLLEKDTVLTMPPIAFYSLRMFELMIMAVIICYSGDAKQWTFAPFNWERTKSMYSDDAVVVFAFAFSTVVMIILGTVIRLFMAKRVMLDSSTEMWQLEEFNPVQEALRNRIIGNHEAQSGELFWMKQAIQRLPDKPSASIAEIARGEGQKIPDFEKWEGQFLRAKVCIAIKEALDALQEYLSPTNQADDGREPLHAGSLIAVRATEGHLSCLESEVIGEWPTENAAQRFVFEPLNNPFSQEPLLSGSKIRIRSLMSGQILGLVPEDSSKDELVVVRDGESLPGPFLLRTSDNWPEPQYGAKDPTVFSVHLTYETAYRNIQRFAKMTRFSESFSGGGLTLLDLQQSTGRGVRKRAQWEKTGWRLYSINGITDHVKLREEVMKVIEVGKQFRAKDGKSVAASEHDGSRDEAYRVVYEKFKGNNPLYSGDSVLLRSNDIGHGVVVGLKQHESKIEVKAGVGMLGSVLTLEQASFETKDDDYVYKWTADQLSMRQDTFILKGSYAEKYRICTVVGHNARSLDVKGITGILHTDKHLHERLIGSLLQAIHPDTELRVHFDTIYEAVSEIKVQNLEHDDNELLVLDVEDDNEGVQGVRDNDQLLQIITKSATLHRPKEMRDWFQKKTNEALSWWLRQQLQDGVTFLVRSQVQKVTNIEVVKKAVDQSSVIATLLPNWEEMGVSELHFKGRHDTFLRRDGMFRMRLSLVETLLSTGWNLRHGEFESAAKLLHLYLQPATLNELRELISGGGDKDAPEDARQRSQDTQAIEILCEDICLAQLEVLSAAWAAIPRIVKEDRPKTLKALFRIKGPHSELQAMIDGLKIAEQRWKAEHKRKSGENLGDKNKNSAVVDMPRELFYFFQRVQPEDMEGIRGGVESTTWISKAYKGHGAQSIEATEVQGAIKEIEDAYRRAESYWNGCVDNADKMLDKALAELEEVVDQEDVKMIMVSEEVPKGRKLVKAGPHPELERIHGMLDFKLVLKEDYKGAEGSDEVPKGRKLVVDQGDVSETFKKNPQWNDDYHISDIHRRFVKELSSKITKQKSVKLLFTSNVDDSKARSFYQAKTEYQKMMRAVKKAAVCFPDTVKVKLDTLSEKLSQSNLRMNNLQGAQKLHIQKVELEKAMEVADVRLQEANTRMNTVQAENDTLQLQKKYQEERNELMERRYVTKMAAVNEEKRRMQEENQQEKDNMKEEQQREKNRMQEEYEAQQQEKQQVEKDLDRQKEETNKMQDDLERQREETKTTQEDLQRQLKEKEKMMEEYKATQDELQEQLKEHIGGALKVTDLENKVKQLEEKLKESPGSREA